MRMMCRPKWPFSLIYESHDMRHRYSAGCRVINRTPEFWGVTESLYNLQLALKGWSDGGALAGSPMPKSASFLLKGKNSIIDGVMLAYLFVVEWVSIYKEKLWLFFLDGDTISFALGEEFLFPYHGPTIKG